MNAFTGREYTAFYARVPAAELRDRPRPAGRRRRRPGVPRATTSRPSGTSSSRSWRPADDTPDDRVHVAADRGAVPRPPARVARSSAARRPSAAMRPRHDRRLPPPLLPRRATSSWPRPAPVDHDDVVAGSPSASRSGTATAWCARTPPGDATSCPCDGRDRPDRAGPPRARLALPAAPAIPTATRSPWPTRSSAAGCPAACSRRSASSGAWRTRSVLAVAFSDAGRVHGSTPARRRSRPGRARPDRRRGRPRRRRRHHRGRARRRRRLPRGSLVLGLEDTGSRMGRHRRADERAGRVIAVDEDVAAPAGRDASTTSPRGRSGCSAARAPWPSSVRRDDAPGPGRSAGLDASRAGEVGSAPCAAGRRCSGPAAGWAPRSVPAVAADPDLDLVAAVDPHHAGLDLRAGHRDSTSTRPGRSERREPRCPTRRRRGRRLHRAAGGPGEPGLAGRQRRPRRGRHHGLRRDGLDRLRERVHRRATASWPRTSPSAPC